MALIDQCIEHLPDSPDDVLAVPVGDLAHRVLELYWPQVRPFHGQLLQQIHGSPNAAIPRAARTLRAQADIGETNLPIGVAQLRAPQAYEAALDEVSICLANQPLRRLQRVSGSADGDAFLYDDTVLQTTTRSAKRARGYVVTLKPGVATGLARLAGLLKPALEIMWVNDVRRMNKFLDAEVPDVAGHLFGRERVSLARVREPFKEAFGGRCFYCAAPLSADNPIDHVLPWSVVGLDGLANLVLSCAACNTDKSHALPSAPIIDRVLGRDRDVLEQIAAAITWPTQYPRVVAAARGLYLGQAPGVPTWAGYRRSERLDLGHPRWWIRVDGADHYAHRHVLDQPQP
ncbi:HNH endonuclease [Mycobacterium koreense]|uniref:HNH endonuclease n=2 Tax=Mycolicibacillus koreensis TaxID=1069220 RepID=A0AA91PHM9_9MYCO|nr:HNH endonuclease [Mycolicibacillus koreensis]OSC35848.1 HNH endonuclease [Mycolicibacillus koreensis]